MAINIVSRKGEAYQWGLVNGFAECVADALSPNDPGATAAMQRNAAVRTMIAAVEAYEAAERIVGQGEPDNSEPRQIADPAWTGDGDAPMVDNPAWALLPRTVAGQDDQGQPITLPDPRWSAYDAATAAIAAASSETKALALWRAGEPSGGPMSADWIAWDAARTVAMAECDRLAAQALDHDPRPVPAAVSDRQFAQGLAMVGTITQAEALAFVKAGEIPAALAQIVATLPAEQQFAANMLISGATSYERHHPLTQAVLAANGWTDAQADSFWRLCSGL